MAGASSIETDDSIRGIRCYRADWILSGTFSHIFFLIIKKKDLCFGRYCWCVIYSLDLSLRKWHTLCFPKTCKIYRTHAVKSRFQSVLSWVWCIEKEWIKGIACENCCQRWELNVLFRRIISMLQQ